MAIPVFRRFTQSDIPNAPNWMMTILNPLNIFCEGIVSSFTQGLTIGQNVQGQKYSTSFRTPADYTTGGFPSIIFSYTGGGQPTCLMIGSLTRNDGTLILLPYAITNWTLNINSTPTQIRINYIAGLDASTQYNMTFIAL